MKNVLTRCKELEKNLINNSKKFLSENYDIKQSCFHYSPFVIAREFGRFNGLRGCDLEIYIIIASYIVNRAINVCFDWSNISNDIEAVNVSFAECSLKYLAFRSNYSLASVKRSLNNLCSLGFISRCGLGLHHRNKYKLLKCWRFNRSGFALINYAVANSEPLNNLKKIKEINKERNIYNNKDLIFDNKFGFFALINVNSNKNKYLVNNDYDEYLKEVIRISKINWLDM